MLRRPGGGVGNPSASRTRYLCGTPMVDEQSLCYFCLRGVGGNVTLFMLLIESFCFFVFM